MKESQIRNISERHLTGQQMTNKTKIIISSFIFFIVTGSIAWLIFFPASENEKIEKVIKDTVAAFADENSKEVLSFISEDFLIEPEIDLETASRQMKVFFFQVKELNASVEYFKHENEKLPKTASEARVLVVVKVSGIIDGEKFQAFGSHGADAVLLTMRKSKGDWQVARARYIDTENPLDALKEIFK
jgi:ketosteroid isomerase-like protein